MPTTRKQKKARKSRGLEMLSDIENLDIMLGENHSNTREREGSLNSNLPRRSRSFASNESENEDGNIGRNQRSINSRTNTECDRNSVTGNSSAEINRLSSEFGKSEKFELFEDLFHTMIKMQPEMPEQMKINHFHSLLKKNALQTFRNINSTNRQNLEDVLVIFRRKYVKPESQATAKHKWHRLVFDPNTMKLPNFLEELNQGAEKAFGPSNENLSSIQSVIDGLPLRCLAATDGQSHHHYLQQYPFIPKTKSCLGP